MCLLLDAEVRATGEAGDRAIGMGDLLAGFFTTTLAEDEVLTEVRVPIPSPDERWGFREFAPRRGDFALAGAATRIALDPDGHVRSAGIVVFGTPDQPVRPADAEAALAGRLPTDDVLAEVAAMASDAIDDPRPDADYRRSLTRALVHRALTDALGQEVKA
jgi:carbon-monoxide dehydrogenase medium subunit